MPRRSDLGQVQSEHEGARELRRTASLRRVACGIILKSRALATAAFLDYNWFWAARRNHTAHAP
ncbi:MAG: hypothetical protein ACLQUY_22555 [Ktedonobacterales bacterium]